MILIAHKEGSPLAKCFRRAPDGSWIDDKAKAKKVLRGTAQVIHLWTYEHHIGDGGGVLRDILNIVETNQRRRDVALIRGRLITAEERREQQRPADGWSRGDLIRRKAASNGGDLVDAPEPYICLDLDSVDVPDGLSGRGAVEWAINQRLASCFHGVSYVYQFSGSSGFKAGLRVKLWFAVSRAVDSAELMTLHENQSLIQAERLRAEGMTEEQIKKVIDGSFWSMSQMTYIAAPALVGLADPHLHDRCGLVHHERDIVHLPTAIKKLREEPQPTREKSSETKRERSDDEVDHGAQALLTRCAQELSNISDGGGRRQALFFKARSLGKLINAGRLTLAEVTEALLKACQANGLINDHSQRIAEKQIEAGLKASAGHSYEHRERTTNSAKRKQAKRFESPPAPPPPTTAPATDDELNAEVARIINEAIMAAERGEVAAVRVPVGCGKTRAAITAAIERLRVKTSSAVVFSSASYTLIGEAEQTLKDLGGAPKQRIEGRLRGCAKYLGGADAEGQMMVEELAEGATLLSLCKSLECPFRGSCALHEAEKQKLMAKALKTAAPVTSVDLSGKISFTPHAMLPHLDRYAEKLDEPPLVIIDETPPVAFFTEADLEELDLIAEPKHSEILKEWQTNNSAIVEWSKAAAVALADLAEQRKKHLNGHVLDITPAALVDSLAGLKHLAEKVIEQGPPKKPRTPDSAAKVIEVIKDHKLIRSHIEPPPPSITSRALRVVYALAEMVTNKAPQSIALCVDYDRTWLELGSPFKLPQKAHLVILDATLNQERWSLIAAAAGRKLTIIEGDQARLAPHQARGFKIRSGSFSRRNMVRGGRLSDRGAQAFIHAGGLLQDRGLLTPDQKIGIGSHRPLINALEDARQGRGPLAQAGGWSSDRFVWGYTGRDHKGSNAFRSVDVLVIVGDPKPNPRGERRAFETLTFNAVGAVVEVAPAKVNEDYIAETTAAQVQWIGRARHQRRSGVTMIYIGAEEPPEVAGVEWGSIGSDDDPFMPSGAPRSDDRSSAEAEAWAQLARGESVSQSSIECLGVTRQQARSIWLSLVERAEGIGGRVTKSGRTKLLSLLADMVIIDIREQHEAQLEGGDAVSVEKQLSINYNHIEIQEADRPPPPTHLRTAEANTAEITIEAITKISNEGTSPPPQQRHKEHLLNHRPMPQGRPRRCDHLQHEPFEELLW